jgi:hypothetical protein
MTDIINCPSCQRKLQVPEALIGQDVQCPGCSATFVARVGGSAPQAKAPPPAPSPNRWPPDRGRDENRAQRDYGEYEDDFADDYRPRRRDLPPHRGALILTLGILGFFIFITAPIAWIMGNTDIKEIRAGRMDPEGEGLTQGGRICGIIGTAYFGLVLLGCCCVFVGGALGGR